MSVSRSVTLVQCLHFVPDKAPPNILSQIENNVMENISDRFEHTFIHTQKKSGWTKVYVPKTHSLQENAHEVGCQFARIIFLCSKIVKENSEKNISRFSFLWACMKPLWNDNRLDGTGGSPFHKETLHKGPVYSIHPVILREKNKDRHISSQN